jgi:hypothetical protein
MSSLLAATASVGELAVQFWPDSVIRCFVHTSEQTQIISQDNINWLVFINEKESIYCEVRAVRAVWAPDDGRKTRPKHVELRQQ